ncbi:TPA: hypothetical protein ACGO3D_002168 [Streptococcus suis]
MIELVLLALETVLVELVDSSSLLVEVLVDELGFVEELELVESVSIDEVWIEQASRLTNRMTDKLA